MAATMHRAMKMVPVSSAMAASDTFYFICIADLLYETPQTQKTR